MNGLPADVHQLITRHFDSVESIEIMLLLRRSPQTFWAAPAVAQQLGIREEVAGAKMAALANARIFNTAESTQAYRFAPADDDLRRCIDGLVAAYSDRRVSVINTIYSANLERLRAFSNAFKVK